MVAVVTELMVGGECSTEGDWTKGSARALVSKPLAQSVASQRRTGLFALDNIFALIDEYIAADLSLAQTNSCSHAADHTLPVPTMEITYPLPLCVGMV
jgi:hypothetical protein